MLLWASLQGDDEGGCHGEHDLQYDQGVETSCAERVPIEEIIDEDCDRNLGKLKESRCLYVSPELCVCSSWN